MGIIVRLSNPDVRQLLFQRVLVNLGIQGNYTPKVIVDRMLEKAGDLTGKTIMVMFNLELLEGLYQRGLTSQVTFIADSGEEEKFAKAFYKVRTLKYDTEAWANLDKTMEDIMAKMNVAPDITFTNPPYNRGLDLKILRALKESNLLKKLICVHPATWLIDIKENPLFDNFKELFDKHTSALDIFNGNPVFGIGLFAPCVIIVVDINALYKIKTITWYGEMGWQVASFKDVTIHGRAWNPLIKDFMDKVSILCEKNGSVVAQLIHCKTVESKKFQIQLAKIRGNVNTENEIMFQDDMYTILQKDISQNTGVRNKEDLPIDKTVLQIGSKKEQENLLNYLASDFSRFCLSLLKTNQNLTCGQSLSIVPWMDFTRSWTDDELFSELGYHKGHAIREYAKKFLPDYHNIYPNGKTY